MPIDLSWTLDLPAPTPATATVSPVATIPSLYGSDMRTFLPQEDGTLDWDPYMLFVNDDRTTLGETVQRILQIPRAGGRSALFFSPNTGFDLRQLVNASFDPNQRSQTETAIAQALDASPLIASAAVTIAPVTAAGLMIVTMDVVGRTAGETVRLVVAVDAVTVKLLDFRVNA